jgi:hypothetical protein
LRAGLAMLNACKHTHRPYLSVQCWSCVDAYSVTRICLHRHWLQWKLQPVTAESANSLFIALVTAALESTFVLLGDDKGHEFFSRVNRNYTLFFLSCKRANRTDVCSSHAMCSRDIRQSCTTEQTASDSF